MASDASVVEIMDRARERVPEVLRALKWRLGYRDEDIALACGMTRSAVNARMAGKTSCTPWELAGFAALFDVPIETFYMTVGEAITLCDERGIGRLGPKRDGSAVSKLHNTTSTWLPPNPGQRVA